MGAGNTFAAKRFDHGVALEHLDAGRQGLLHQHTSRIGPRVRHRGDWPPHAVPIEGGAIGMVVAGEQQQPLPRRHGVAVHIGGDGACQHHAGQVVVGECEWALRGAGGQHHLFGADAMQALAWAGRGAGAQVIGAAFQRGDEVVVVVAKRGGAGQQRDLGAGTQFAHGRGDPLDCRRSVDGFGHAEQAAAELVLLIDQHDPRIGPRRGEGGGDAGRAATDDQHVAMVVQPVVNVGVGAVRHRAQPGAAPQQGFPAPPQPRRPHEELVVEAGRQHRRESAGEPFRPAEGAARGHQAVVQFHLRGALVGDARGANAQVRDGVRLLGAAADHAAPSPILEAPRHGVHAVREQRGGERVALAAPQGTAVEGELQWP